MSDKPEDHEDLELIPQAEKASLGYVDDATPEELIGAIKIFYKSKRKALLLTPRRIIIADLGALTPLGILFGVGFGWFLGDFLANRRLETLRNMPPGDVLNQSRRNFEIMHTNITSIHVKRGWSGDIQIFSGDKKYKFGPRNYKDLEPAIDLIQKTSLSDKLTIT